MSGKNIEFASALQESVVGFSTEIDSNGNKTNFQFCDWGTGFELQHGNATGFFSTNEYDGVGTTLIDLAHQIKKNNSLKITKIDKVEKSIVKFQSDLTKSGKLKEFEIESEVIINDINGLMQDIKSAAHYSIKLQELFFRKNFQSTDFLDITQAYSITLLNFELQSKFSSYPITLVDMMGGITNDDISWDKIQIKIDELSKCVNSLTQTYQPKPGKYDTVLIPDTSYSLAHETIGHGCEADQIINESSFLSNMIGHKATSSEITIVDDSHIHAAGWSEYDDEGTKTQGTLLIDEGILVNYLHTKKTAKLLGGFSTGNARATSYLSPAEPRQSNLFIEPKDHKLEELIEEIKNGLLIGPTLSASTSIYTGEFSIRAQYCREIVNGEIKQMLGPTTITGFAVETLNNVIAVGRETSTFPSKCMKDDSALFVGAIAPALALKGMQIN